MQRSKPLPTWAELLDMKIDGAMSSLNCISLGTIKSFDSESQTASIEINYKRIIKEASFAQNNIDSKDKVIEYPLLVKCPVIFLSGGDARLTMPVEEGDTCILFFCDREIDSWFRTGVATFPQSDRMHDLTDAIALVGIRSTKNPIESFNETLSALIDLHGERLHQTGDVKPGLQTDDHSGWLLMCGRTVSKDGAGGYYTGEMYHDLFDILKLWEPNAGTEDFDDGDTVIIPDMRGRGWIGADNMGGSQADVLTSAFTSYRNVLGADVGEETHLLTGRESGIQQHHHAYYRATSTGGGADSPGGSGTGNYTQNTGDTGHTDAIDRHYTVHPSKIGNWFVKI